MNDGDEATIAAVDADDGDASVPPIPPSTGAADGAPDPWNEDTSELILEPDHSVLPTIRTLWTWWSWTMVAVVLALTAAAVAADVLRASIVLDVVSVWPYFALVAIGAIVWFVNRASWPSRFGSAVALLALTGLLAVLALHITAWHGLPSSVESRGRPFTGGEAALTMAVPGRLELRSSSLPVSFSASLLTGGGNVAVPSADGLDTEPPDVTLAEHESPGLHRGAGWAVVINEAGRWRLTVEATDLDADLSGTMVDTSVFRGGGNVVVAAVAAGAQLRFESGTFVVSVPSDAGIGVEGVAEVPSEWTTTERGATSPEGGGDFTLIVATDATVRVIES